jgi:hypothetical protein
MASIRGALAAAAGFAVAVLAYQVGHTQGKGNRAPRYGDGSGLPANCRALIQANIDGARAGRFSHEEALRSIERNCGVAGSLWSER